MKQLMKAVICTRYGAPDVLQIREVPKPVCGDRQIIVKIVATAVNSGDVRVRALKTTGFLKLVMRFVLGFSKPRKAILGTVFAGVVSEVGKDAKQYKVGEKVFGATGFGFGTYAQYIALSEKAIMAPMPSNASFEEAAALPFGWQTAIYFLQKAGIEILKNSKVLIYGATGSVGTAAVQLARHYNATVTAVCSAAGKELVLELGIAAIICYDKEDFTKTAEKFDIVFDAVGKTSKRQCRHLLKPGGQYVTVGGLSVAAEKAEQLESVRSLFEQEKCLAVIDKVYDLDDIVEAHRYVDMGRKKGNVVVRVNAGIEYCVVECLPAESRSLQVIDSFCETASFAELGWV